MNAGKEQEMIDRMSETEYKWRYERAK